MFMVMMGVCCLLNEVFILMVNIVLFWFGWVWFVFLCFGFVCVCCWV